MAGKIHVNIVCQNTCVLWHVSCNFRLCWYIECFSGKNNLKTHLVIEVFLYVADIEEYKLDTFCITECEMFMKWLGYTRERFQITLDIMQIL